MKRMFRYRGMSIPVRTSFAIAGTILGFITNFVAQESRIGTIKGSVVDGSAHRPLEFVNVVLRQKPDSAIVTGNATDKSGKFEMLDVPAGNYFVTFSLIGYKEKLTPSFTIDSLHKHLNLGEISLVPTTVDLDEVLVTAEKSMFNNSIDRKVYNVDQDLMSKAGSASELLQNVPSVQVDIDGNISLRGSSNVLIMINGKSSPLMDKNSAEALQQMPASSIEKIEVITNPSAKYKPDGTSGIINIVQKKNTSLGINGSVTANAGNQSRYNGNVRLNYDPGNYNMYASYGLRKDNRNRTTTDTRVQSDAASPATFYNGDLLSLASPLSNILALGLDYHVNEQNQLGISGNYFVNTFTRTDDSYTHLQDEAGTTTEEYHRNRFDPEYEKEYGVTAYLQHDFSKQEHTLRLEYTASQSPEQEDNHFTNTYLVPATSASYDNTLIKQDDKEHQVSLDYVDPLGENSTLEAGYAGEFKNSDFDFYAEYFDTSQHRFVRDDAKTNRFLFDESINALYATYKQSFGAFGFLGGLRGEWTYRTSNLVTKDSVMSDSYRSMFPTVHLSYKLTGNAELQLSYSRRIHRPDGEDLNPFPEYRDPRNISGGNPGLLPEYIHSVELGCQFQNDLMSLLPAVYYRYTDNKFTSLTQAVNDSTLLTTRQNLSNDRSGGLEIIVSANLGEIVTAHWSANGFYNQIDAANLGYGETKSITTWSSALTVNINIAKGSRVQINSNYNSSRLTPQGEYRPSYVVNTGIRQELLDGKASLIVTVADIFKTQKRQLELHTPLLQQTVVNMRDSRIVYFGFTYNFGSSPKKSKEEQLHYDDNF